MSNKKSEDCYLLSNSIHFNKGKIDNVAFVFSCPGSKEYENRQPVSGRTGANLDSLLEILRDSYSLEQLFGSFCRYDYRITNASSQIHHNSLDKKSEPNYSEISNVDNLARLKQELNGFKIIIAFGVKAIYAVKKAMSMNDIILIESMHLSLSSINLKINKDIEGYPIFASKSKEQRKLNTKKRLTVIADQISKSIPDDINLE